MLTRAPTASGVKAAQRSKSLALMPAQGGGARVKRRQRICKNEGALFEHFVGAAEQCERKSNAKRLGGL
jgi:hypothetical protein